MYVNLYSVLDKKSKTANPPFPAVNDDVAKRNLICSLTPESQLVLYPSDYELHFIGRFSDETMELIDGRGSALQVSVVDLVPPGLRKYALDGSFGGVTNGKAKEDSAT